MSAVVLTAAAVTEPADRHAAMRPLASGSDTPGGPRRDAGRAADERAGDVALWRLRREAAATGHTALQARMRAQHAHGETLRAESATVRATAACLAAACAVLRGAVRAEWSGAPTWDGPDPR